MSDHPTHFKVGDVVHPNGQPRALHAVRGVRLSRTQEERIDVTCLDDGYHRPNECASEYVRVDAQPAGPGIAEQMECRCPAFLVDMGEVGGDCPRHVHLPRVLALLASRPAAQEPTEDEVEAAARTWAESGPTTATWEQMTEERREHTRERMRHCLFAAHHAMPAAETEVQWGVRRPDGIVTPWPTPPAPSEEEVREYVLRILGPGYTAVKYYVTRTPGEKAVAPTTSESRAQQLRDLIKVLVGIVGDNGGEMNLSDAVPATASRTGLPFSEVHYVVNSAVADGLITADLRSGNLALKEGA